MPGQGAIRRKDRESRRGPWQIPLGASLVYNMLWATFFHRHDDD